MVGRVGIEPTTISLKGCCSATELPTRDGSKISGMDSTGNMEDIITTLWFDGHEARSLRPGDAGEAFKWILARRPEGLLLVAMPDSTELDFHKELRDTVYGLRGWEPDDKAVLGGGVHLRDGEILHRSTYFGPMPEEFQGPILEILGLN